MTIQINVCLVDDRAGGRADHRALKVSPGYEPTAEAKQRADDRLWAVLSE